jgi:hypothetical protein
MLGLLSAGLYAQNLWVDVVVAAVYLVGALGYSVVQIVRHCGGTELTRARWIWGPDWWRRFATDDFENPQSQGGHDSLSPSHRAPANPR